MKTEGPGNLIKMSIAEVLVDLQRHKRLYLRFQSKFFFNIINIFFDHVCVQIVIVGFNNVCNIMLFPSKSETSMLALTN